jgi:hypothetical protein
MKFGVLFEYHKIPEWYENYFTYNEFVKDIELFTSKRFKQDVSRLPGIFYLALARNPTASQSQGASLFDSRADAEDCLVVPVPILTSGFSDVIQALKNWLRIRSGNDDILDSDESNEEALKE